MFQQPTVIKVPQQDLLADLQTFIKTTSANSKTISPELTKTALRLLKHLPAARHAILQYFNNVFEEFASNYVQEVKADDGDLILPDIYLVLVNLITDTTTAWVPLISSWSLDLLGEISSKFASKLRINKGLNETLQYWLNCKATKILVDINTRCITTLIHSDSCINALLDTSIKHSPNFDWVVAHVGRCFPHIVITKVLSCGLRDFALIKSIEQGRANLKLKSVVGILEHLARSHSNDIQKAVEEMFLESLEQKQKITVPYILQLSLLSSVFFESIFNNNINKVLNVAVLEKMIPFVEDWCKYFGSVENFEEILINLILGCNGTMINLLLECLSVNNENIKNKVTALLQTLLYKVDENVRNGRQVKLLQTIANEQIHKLLTQSVCPKLIAKLVIYLGQTNISTLTTTIGYLLQNSTNSDNLVLLVKILTNEMADKFWQDSGLFHIVLQQILSLNRPSNNNLEQTWTNLLILLQWEKNGVALLNSGTISRAIQSNLISLNHHCNNNNIHIIGEILDILSTPNKNDNLQVKVVLNLTQIAITYFFVCCKDDGSARKARGFHKAGAILRRLCTYSKVAKVFALREILEGALFRNDSILFGAQSNTYFDDNYDKLLLEQNRRINKTIPLTKHSSVFNGGIIGKGKRKLVVPDKLADDVISANINELINIIKACCACETENKYYDVSLDSITLVSLLLVQFVSPDVMYNGLPWPDEEFSKVTVERDLSIRRSFTNLPVLWDLLNFVAVYRPALCYCSVLIRALTATLIHQWKSTNDINTDNYKSLLNVTIKVIDVLAVGQLLPPPLANIRDVLPYLKCFEIVAILKDSVWCYMRDHIPSPALFTCDTNGIYWRDPTVSRPSELYTNTLRIIMQRNIETVGHIYAQMFINVPKHE